MSRNFDIADVMQKHKRLYDDLEEYVAGNPKSFESKTIRLGQISLDPVTTTSPLCSKIKDVQYDKKNNVVICTYNPRREETPRYSLNSKYFVETLERTCSLLAGKFMPRDELDMKFIVNSPPEFDANVFALKDSDLCFAIWQDPKHPIQFLVACWLNQYCIEIVEMQGFLR